MRRNEVFITNVVKCRPPGNRDPEPAEIEACSDYLERQIRAINPRVIVTLGRHSMGRYLANAKISELHGKAINVKGKLIIPMYHPAAALHQPSLKSTVIADFSSLPELIAKAETGSAPLEAGGVDSEPKKEAKQLSLF